MIAPDHGPLWRRPEDIQRIISLWGKWAKQEPTRKIVIVYDTMWKSTAAMAHSIADGAMTKGVAVEVLTLSGTHRSDIATEVLTAGALVIGSPTLNGSMFPTVADTLCYIKGLRPVNLVGQTFGSYGWGGEATKEITEILTKMHVKLIGAPITAKYVPDEAELFKCRQLGEEIANYLIANIAVTHGVINL